MTSPYLQWEEQREPAQHVFGYLSHTVWVYAETNVAVEHGLEVSSEAVQDASVRYVEGELRRAGIMAVRQWKPCPIDNVSARVTRTRGKLGVKGAPCSVSAASFLGCSNSQHS